MRTGRPPVDIAVRAERFILRPSGVSGCWLWTGNVSSHGGVPVIWLSGRNRRVTRIFWERLHGAVSDGFFVQQSCGIEECCNPAHSVLRPRAVEAGERVVEAVRLLGPTGCLEWTGYLNKYGYGVVGKGRGAALSHRVAFEHANGPIPDGLCVLHRCDNPPCCNADHLFLGTRADNHADMMKKGRGRWNSGVANHKAKLTLEQIEEARSTYGVPAGRELASRFGVHLATVRKHQPRQASL